MKKSITICTSGSFYKQALEIEKELNKSGFKVHVPATARAMQKTKNFNISHYKTWFNDPKNFPIKAQRMRKHFHKISQSDAILVVNYEKNGMKGYIGGNGLMEMGLAFYFKKPIFILNSIDEKSIFKEEILGMLPVFLDGEVEGIKKYYVKKH